jgi:thioredoxin 1
MKEITEGEYEREVILAEGPVLLMFTAPWCAHCKGVTPSLAELEGELAGGLSVRTIDVAEAPRLAAMHDVLGLPTMVLLRGGRSVLRIEGARTKARLRELLSDELPFG